MGRSSNSPPPKSAHKQTNARVAAGEWLQWAITEVINKYGPVLRQQPALNSRLRG
jgi:hypothetical protein